MTIERIATRARFAAVLALLIYQPLVAHSSGTTTGAISPAPAPPSVVWDELQSNTQIFLIAEQSSVIASADINLDVDGTPGLYNDPADLLPGVIPAGTAVNVYLLHFDPLTVPQRLSGSVTFAQQILGLAFSRAGLMESDAFGAPGTEYPAGEIINPRGPFNREFELALAQGPAADSAMISADRRTLTIDMGVTAYYDELRVFTAVPEPNTLAFGLAGAASLMLVRRGRLRPRSLIAAE